MNDRIDFSVQLARRVGELSCRYYHRLDITTALKDDHSIVTEADIIIDEQIGAAIQERYPGDLLLSEESSTSQIGGAGTIITQPTWIIDPIDGTTNFAIGVPIWGILITYLEQGWPLMTVMYFPLLDELYTAVKGQGAYLNHQPIQATNPFPRQPLAFFACCSRTHRDYQVSIPYKTRLLGSAAYNFCLAARGAALIAFEATPKIWDIAGAWLLVGEAGGVIEPFDGALPFPLRSGVAYHRQVYPTLAAITPELMSKGRQWIRPRSPE
jgi:myo-inositol-1(or 4)-monophosphatase